MSGPNTFSKMPSTPDPCNVRPPSTTMFWPVMKRAMSEQRKTTTSAMSSGSPIRPAGVPFSKRATWSGKTSNIGSVMVVRIMPGDTALTRMDGAYSDAAGAVSAATAALLAVYGPSPAAGRVPLIDAVLTMAPPPLRQQMRHRRPEPGVDPGQVDPDDPVPLGRIRSRAGG